MLGSLHGGNQRMSQVCLCVLGLPLKVAFNMFIYTHLLSILDFCSGSIVSFLKEDLLHLAILKVVQLSHRILCPLYKIHQHRVWAFTLQKSMLEGSWGTQTRQSSGIKKKREGRNKEGPFIGLSSLLNVSSFGQKCKN